MTTRKVYVLVFEGFADWEPAYALCQINQSGRYEVVTAGFSGWTVKSMGGLSVRPDVSIDRIEASEAAMLILPGGTMWEPLERQDVLDLLRRLHDAGVPIAAICAATLEIARAGLTRGMRHTSNSKEYLQNLVPRYKDGDFYVNELAVTDGRLITASGLGSLEFGREILKMLSVYSEAETEMWFEMFKRGVIPESLSHKG